MSETILVTKLFLPPPQPRMISRSRLIERLNEGRHRKVTLISAPAGFGKTTLVSEWASGCKHPVAWLSLDDGDSDPTRFLAYLVAALQTVAPSAGQGIEGISQSPQPLSPEAILTGLTTLLNNIAALQHDITLVLDDYHLVDAEPVDRALSFLIERLPPHMHLVIATREDPRLHLPRLRARNQLSEVRATDLRFNHDEAAEFLNQVTGLNLAEEDVAALETRTEGWIAGLQLAAISMRGHDDTSGFITSFTGSHRFVLDYLLEEVLHQQPERIQNFLLRTSVLNRLCGALCDAVLEDASRSGQDTLEHLENANLFIVPLDDERRWYRYHHLFGELLRQRLHQGMSPDSAADVAELHQRASAWFEANRLEVEAFQHAVAADDIERAERLIDGNGMPLHFRGAVVPVLNWLESLPATTLDAWPSLWTTYASVLLVTGRLSGVEEKLHAADAALRDAAASDRTRDLIGRNAAVRATLAATLKQVDDIITHSRRALEYLHPDNLAFRTSTAWKLGYAYHLQGDRAAAGRAYADVVSASQASGNAIFAIMATIGLGRIQESALKLHDAANTYQQVLSLLGDRPLSVTGDVHLGLARISYEWNDPDAAQQHGQQSLLLARQTDQHDRIVACLLFLARLKSARRDVHGADALIASATETVRQHALAFEMPDVVSAQVHAFLRAGNITDAAALVGTHDLPISRARVFLAQGNSSAALTTLEPLRRQTEAPGWESERLTVRLLQAIASDAMGDTKGARRTLGDALALAEPGEVVRAFVDEGSPMKRLLTDAVAHGVTPEYARTLLAAFEHRPPDANVSTPHAAELTIEPLSPREQEVLQLIAQGLSNHEIANRLYLSLNTVKGHNRVIFRKLQVRRRTEAVARARELNLLASAPVPILSRT